MDAFVIKRVPIDEDNITYRETFLDWLKAKFLDFYDRLIAECKEILLVPDAPWYHLIETPRRENCMIDLVFIANIFNKCVCEGNVTKEHRAEMKKRLYDIFQIPEDIRS